MDFNARMYDHQTGRFWHPDPLSELDRDVSLYAYANNNPILVNDPTGLMGDTILTNKPQSTPGFTTDNPATASGEVTVTAKGKLDAEHGQVYWPRSDFSNFWNGNRLFPAHIKFGNEYIATNFEVDKNGYLTGKIAPILCEIDVPVDKVPLNLTALIRLKNFIKGEYSVYKAMKNGLLYIGKAKVGIKFRYTAAEIEKMGVEVIEGLDKVPNNVIALGVEQLTIDLNGGVGTGMLSNINNATIKELYINEARYWLDNNIPNWEHALKFQ